MALVACDSSILRYDETIRYDEEEEEEEEQEKGEKKYKKLNWNYHSSAMLSNLE